MKTKIATENKIKAKYFNVSEVPVHKTVAVNDDLIIDFGEKGEVVGVEVLGYFGN
jgi:uncharacterized protein YuzE